MDLGFHNILILDIYRAILINPKAVRYRLMAIRILAKKGMKIDGIFAAIFKTLGCKLSVLKRAVLNK